jgi:hypothetical protein
VVVLVLFIGQVFKMHQHLLKLPLVVEVKAAFHGQAIGTLEEKTVYLTLVAEVALLETMNQQAAMVGLVLW